MPTCIDETGTESLSCWTTEYWLWHCEGYRVFSSEGPVGYVEEVLDSGDDGASALLVRVGEIFTQLVTVPIDAIEGFDPVGERVFIGSLAEVEEDAQARQLRIPAAV